MAILSKGQKTDKFESRNSLKISLTKILEVFVIISLKENLSLNLSKLPWNSCSMLDKCRWLNWVWKFLAKEQSSFNPKEYCYWHGWSCSLSEGRTSLYTGLISRKLCGFIFMFSSGFISFSVLLLYLLSIIFFVFMQGFWCYFI